MRFADTPNGAVADRSIARATRGLSRRGFMLGAAASTCGLACLSGIGCARIDRSVPGLDSEPARRIGEVTYARLHALADAVLPSRDEAPFDAASLRVAERLSSSFLSQGRRMPIVIRGALFVLEYLPLVTERAGTPFSRATRPKRQEILQAWLKSGLAIKRLISSSMRKAVMLSAYSHPDTWSTIHYQGPWVSPDRPAAPVYPLGMGVSPETLSGRTLDPARLEWEKLIR